MKVRAKLIISFIGIVGLLWLIAILALNSYQNLHKNFSTAGADIIPDTIAMTEIETISSEIYREFSEYLYHDIEEAKESARLKLERLKGIAFTYLPLTAYPGMEEHKKDCILAGKAYDFYFSTMWIIGLKERGASIITLKERDRSMCLPALLEMQERAGELKAASISGLEEIERSFNTTYNSGLYSILTAAATLTLLAIAAAIITTRSITHPLLALRKGTNEIARGNLDYKVATDARDEIGELSRAFDRMTTSLSSSMTSIDNLNREIVERKRAEEKRQAILATAIDGFWMCNMEGKFLEVNDSYCRMTGYTREELLEMYIQDVEALEYPEETARRIEAIIEHGSARFETKHRRKDGKIVDMEISVNHWHTGDEERMFVFVRDITERKRAEAELKRALAELEQSSARLAATNKELEAFSYSVSHDLRSPLRSIDGFSQALLEDYAEKLDESGRDYLQRLRAASQKMGELIDGLLILSRLTRSEMRQEQVDLTSLAEEVSTRLQEAQPDRKVEFIIGKGLTARGDPQLLRVLIENLFGNAWKFTGKKQQAKIEFGSIKANGKWTYFVKDNGAGFDMTYADKLFGAFQRLHDVTEFPGNGIGLATVQRIINRHGGTIRAEGAEGKGAAFYFTLE